MMFIDVDEFIYSPSWTSSKPSKSLLQSLLPTHPYGQIIIRCYEFGPSKQKTHPLTGVTQDGYKSKKVNLGTAVVNHYKFQAWTEFKTKFRRRVSAYVVDWTRSVNLKSNDRAPGLGYHAVEPKGCQKLKLCVDKGPTACSPAVSVAVFSVQKDPNNNNTAKKDTFVLKAQSSKYALVKKNCLITYLSLVWWQITYGIGVLDFY
ncbi:hypothetical protein R6Q59_037172 [Mikania micrantha]